MPAELSQLRTRLLHERREIHQQGRAVVPVLGEQGEPGRLARPLRAAGPAAAERNAKVEVRLRRQRLLARAVPRAPHLDVVLSEAVLRRPLRDRSAMARQLDALVVTSRRHNVSLRVLPMEAGLFRWASTGTFTMLEFPIDVREPEPTTVYMDGPCGAVYLDRAHEIQIYEDAWRSLGERALGETESREVIAAIAEEMTDEA